MQADYRQAPTISTSFRDKVCLRVASHLQRFRTPLLNSSKTLCRLGSRPQYPEHDIEKSISMIAPKLYRPKLIYPVTPEPRTLTNKKPVKP